MRTASSLILVLALGPGIASAQLSPKIDPRGVIGEVRLGDEVFLTDLAVSVEKPEWSGRLADQRDVDPATVHARRDGPITHLSMPLKGDEFQGRMIQRVTRLDDGVALDYEVFPDDDVEIEAIVLQGRLSADRHAGKTSHFADDDAPKLLPAEPGEGPALLWSGEPKSLGLTADGRTLRLSPRDAELQLLDLRNENDPAFVLRATAGGGEHLARKPIHLGLILRAVEPVGQAARSE